MFTNNDEIKQMADVTNVAVSAGGKISDRGWVRQSFIMQAENFNSDALALLNRTFSTAAFKAEDTTLGGSIEINPIPQFTRTADIKVPSVVTPRTGDTSRYNLIYPKSQFTKGIGRYYSEAISDNKHIISMRFGVPQFNSLTTFFQHFYSHEAGVMARTGRSESLWYTLGKVAGFLLPLLNLPLLLISVGGAIWKMLTVNNNSRYYYLKPTMPLYWNAVQSMVNNLAVNKGIVPRVFTNTPGAKVNGQYNFTPDDLKQYAQKLSDVIMTDSNDETVGVNVYAMATRHQRLARKINLEMQRRLEAAAENATVQDEKAILTAIGVSTQDTSIFSKVANVTNIFSGIRLDKTPNANPSFKAYLYKYLSSNLNKPSNIADASSPQAVDSKGNAVNPQSSSSSNTTSTQGQDARMTNEIEEYPTPDKTDAGFWDFVNAELDDGSQFVSFRVEENGPVGESFSNNVGDTDIATKLNSMSAGGRSTKFSLAGGNLGDGAIASTIQSFISAAGDVVAGVADGVGLSGLAMFGGAAFVDIPKYWQSSLAQLPRMNYSFTLVSPYGNKLSQLFNLYVPLCMILAGALPLATGKQSYTSPFILELYDRGRAQTRLGMIDSININRGVGHLGFDNAGNAMAIEVSFSVVNLSSIMYMPISQGFDILSPISSVANLVDQDNAFTDYMAVLGSLTLDEQIYFADKLRRNLTKVRQNMRSWFSRAHTAQWFTSISPVKFASVFYSGVINR